MNESPTERLVLTRERLRVALIDPAAYAAGGGVGSAGTLAGLGGVGLLLQAARRWWSSQPLNLALPLVTQLATSTLRPVAQRWPLGLVAAACGAGALLVWSRPWRWRATQTLVAGLLPQLLVKALALWPAQPSPVNPRSSLQPSASASTNP